VNIKRYCAGVTVNILFYCACVIESIQRYFVCVIVNIQQYCACVTVLGDGCGDLPHFHHFSSEGSRHPDTFHTFFIYSVQLIALHYPTIRQSSTSLYKTIKQTMYHRYCLCNAR